MKIIVSGGTGFLGAALVEELMRRGHQVTILTRQSRKPSSPQLQYAVWDAKNVGPWAHVFENTDVVINLTGESIAAKRWTDDQKKVLKESRLNSTRAIVEAIASCRNKPKVLINASAVGYYGNVENGDVTEAAPRGEGVLAELCELWEKEACGAENFGLRVVLIRIGIVLEKGGGALEKMIPPFQMFAGGPLGSGKQGFPWIHRDDVIGIILFSIENAAVSGPVNTTAPHPLTMKEFCSALGKAMFRPSWAPVPAFALKLLLGEMSEMLLGGVRAVPQKLNQLGYSFKYPKVDQALKAIFRR